MVLDLAPGLQWRTRLASVGAGQLSVRRKCQMCSREIAFLWHLHMPVSIYLHNDKASLFVRPGRYPGPPHKQRYARYDGAADDTSCGSQLAAVSCQLSMHRTKAQWRPTAVGCYAPASKAPPAISDSVPPLPTSFFRSETGFSDPDPSAAYSASSRPSQWSDSAPR
jgi:hypothetical protein